MNRIADKRKPRGKGAATVYYYPSTMTANETRLPELIIKTFSHASPRSWRRGDSGFACEKSRALAQARKARRGHDEYTFDDLL